MTLSAAQMQAAVIRNLPAKIGKSLEQWIEVASRKQKLKDKEIIAYLKTEHQLGHVQAQTVVWRLRGEKRYVETTGYEENIFSTPALWADYVFVKEQISSLGKDVSIQPCKTYIPFYRDKQFAVVAVKNRKLFIGIHLPKGEHDKWSAAHGLGGSERINFMAAFKKEEWNILMLKIKQAYELK